MNAATRTAADNPFSARTVAAILLVAILAFGTWVVLMAWSPELAKRDTAGPHPYAKSATGYAGLVTLLEAQDIPVSVSRRSRNIETYDRGLMILSLRSYGMGAKLDELYLAEPALIILPKWSAPPDRRKQEWAREMTLLRADLVENVLDYYDTSGEILHASSPTRVNTPYGQFEPHFTDKIQLIKSDELEPVIRTSLGILLAKLPDRDVYILSDPDVMNTLGIAEFENARLAVSILNDLRGSAETPVVLDATLHGFERSESLLKLALDIPYIGVTLITLAALGLLGWGAVIRFGSPEVEGRAIALGKEALADNTAGLVSMARRETHMAPGYLALTRRATAKSVGAPKTLTEAELAELFDRMSESGELTKNWSAQARGLIGQTKTRDELLEKARALHLWRKEMTHGNR